MCRVTSSQVGQIRPLRFKVQKVDAPSRGCVPAGAFKVRSEVPPGMVPRLLREALRLDAL